MDLEQKVNRMRENYGPAGVSKTFKGANYKDKLRILDEDNQEGSGNAVKRKLGQVPTLGEETRETLKEQKRFGKKSVDKPINTSKVRKESFAGMPNSVRYMYGLPEKEPKTEEEYREVFKDVENELAELEEYEYRTLDLTDAQEKRLKELRKKRNELMEVYNTLFGKEIYGR